MLRAEKQIYDPEAAELLYNRVKALSKILR